MVDIQVHRNVFGEAVFFASKLLPQRTSVPILSGLLLEAEHNQLKISCYDYDSSAQVVIDAQVDSPGRALVSARLLAEISSRLPQAPIKLSTEEGKLLVSAGSAKFSLALMPVEEYPNLPAITGDSVVIDATNFSNAIAQVVVASSKDDVTPVIKGVLLDADENGLDIIATDRYRVAVQTLSGLSGAGEFSALVPARVLQEVGKSFLNSEKIEIVLAEAGDNAIIGFRDDTKTVTSLLIKGNFPPVKKLFPEEIENFAIINTQELIEATRRVQTVLEREAALRFSFTQDGVVLDAIGSEHAQASEEVGAQLTGDDLVVSLKPQFLIDGLSALHSEQVKLGFTKTDNPNKPGPVLITAADSAGGNYRYLLQPNLLLR